MGKPLKGGPTNVQKEIKLPRRGQRGANEQVLSLSGAPPVGGSGEEGSARRKSRGNWRRGSNPWEGKAQRPKKPRRAFDYEE